MKNLFISNGISVTDTQYEKFEKYYDLLTFYNKKFNITAITDRKEVFNKHFIDSCLGEKLITGKTFIDVGAGGGFPSVPLLILREDLRGFLLEATGKKCEFLKVLIKELKLENAEVINGRAEDLAKNGKYRENFDHCVARAVAKLNTLCEYCLPFVKIGGTFVSYKGDADEELKEAEKAIRILGGKLKGSYVYDLDGAKRTLIKIEKIKSTELKYPRGNGKERKNPL